MSQHHFDTEFNGRPVHIQMGWDKPLQGFYMYVEYTDVPEDEDEEFLFNNLYHVPSHPIMIEPFLDVLKKHRISVPEAMIAAVREDREYNRVNVAKGWN